MNFDFSINIVVFFKLIELINTFVNFNFFHFVFRISSIQNFFRNFFNLLHSKNTCLIVCLSRLHEHEKFSIVFLLYKNVFKSILIIRNCIAIALNFLLNLSYNFNIDLLDFVIIEYNVLFLSQFFHSLIHWCCIFLFTMILIAFFNIFINCVCETIWFVFIFFRLFFWFFSFHFVICLIATFVFSLFSMSTWIDIQCNFISMFWRRKSSINHIIHFIKYWFELIFEL